MFENYPKANLAFLPTPLEKIERFSSEVGDINIYMKRDDNTGLAMGGNKARKLEFLMGDAKSKGADTVLTTGGPQSNHARMTAAAARRLGMEPILVLKGREPAVRQGNLLLDDLLGADVRFVDTKDYGEIHGKMGEIASQLESRGRKPYIIPLGGSTPLGALGYVEAFLEIMNQADEMGIKVDYIVNAVGSGGTHAGLLVGAYLSGKDVEIVGISVDAEKGVFQNDIARIATECSRLLNNDREFKPEDIIVFDEYVGEGYGIVNNETVEAITLMARTEGIILGPVYTGKAMSGLIDLIKKGYFKQGSNVVFIHTGGTPALFDKLVK